ncbi:MAG TPA: hypothetical protein PLB64_02815, partial [Kiritimatiellia bacterium]|nr:hypothetical protein [Kiritimatiellia bacterium]
MRKNMFRTRVALLALAALSASAQMATAQVVVTKSAGDKVGIDLSGIQTGGGAAAQVVRRTLENNLNRSGWMQVAAPGKGAVAVRGTITENGGQVLFKCQVTNVVGQSYLNAAYAQPAAWPTRPPTRPRTTSS